MCSCHYNFLLCVFYFAQTDNLHSLVESLRQQLGSTYTTNEDKSNQIIEHINTYRLQSHEEIQLLYFLDFFPRVLLISVRAETQVHIRGWEQNEGGVNIGSAVHAVQSASTRALRYDTGSSLLPATVSADISAATLQALQCTRLFSVPQCELYNHLEAHPPRVNFIIVRALFEGGVNFAQQHSHAQCGIYSRAGRIRGNTVIRLSKSYAPTTCD